MTMTEGMVEEWYVPDGGRVEKGQLLYRLETEKVNLDVDADVSGTVRHGVAVGVMMKPGDVIGVIYGPGETVPASGSTPVPVTPAPVAKADAPTPAPGKAQAAGERASSSPAARRLARELNVDIAAVIGTGPGAHYERKDATRGAPLLRRRYLPPSYRERRFTEGIRKTIAHGCSTPAWLGTTDDGHGGHGRCREAANAEMA
jgi:pyruvate/2-oxoglutarate dehydrogenase complex dihydrolipoamide acyltransferase (E2) component